MKRVERRVAVPHAQGFISYLPGTLLKRHHYLTMTAQPSRLLRYQVPIVAVYRSSRAFWLLVACLSMMGRREQSERVHRGGFLFGGLDRWGNHVENYRDRLQQRRSGTYSSYIDTHVCV